MKKSIVLTALVSILSLGSVLAAVPADKAKDAAASEISIKAQRFTLGISIDVNKNLDQKPVVSISDSQGHEIYKDKLSKRAGAITNLDFSQLDNGNYTVTVQDGQQELKKEIHIYEENGAKTFFFFQ